MAAGVLDQRDRLGDRGGDRPLGAAVGLVGLERDPRRRRAAPRARASRGPRRPAPGRASGSRPRPEPVRQTIPSGANAASRWIDAASASIRSAGSVGPPSSGSGRIEGTRRDGRRGAEPAARERLQGLGVRRRPAASAPRCRPRRGPRPRRRRGRRRTRSGTSRSARSRREGVSGCRRRAWWFWPRPHPERQSGQPLTPGGRRSSPSRGETGAGAARSCRASAAPRRRACPSRRRAPGPARCSRRSARAARSPSGARGGPAKGRQRKFWSSASEPP